MQVSNCPEELPHRRHRWLLFQSTISHHIGLQVTSSTQAHYQVDVLIILEDLMKHYNMRMIHELQQLNFCFQRDQFFPHACLRDLLHSPGSLRHLQRGVIDRPKAPLAQGFRVQLVEVVNFAHVVDDDPQCRRWDYPHSLGEPHTMVCMARSLAVHANGAVLRPVMGIMARLLLVWPFDRPAVAHVCICGTDSQLRCKLQHGFGMTRRVH
mmetsp:Transcript_10337/g.24894  ORF Transcript_10337/g.24894 Transcript_10337/m.24894 type:complete len:210 (-) Transcript_10337:520-1149(-)